MRASETSFGHIFISGVIVAILLAQFLAGIFTDGPRGWPIVSYSMFARAKFDGDRLDHDRKVFAVFNDGSQIEVTREDLGMSYWLFRYNVVNSIMGKDPQKIQFLVTRFCDQADAELVRIEVRDLGISISKQGPISGLPQMTLGSIDFTC